MYDGGDAQSPLFTIGHSNRSLDAFVKLLRAARIGHVVDIRKIPMSRTNPQFNTDSLPAAMAAVQISYEHIAALGGRRGRVRNLSPEVNGFWANQSFHNYADYALTEPFRDGLDHLIDVGGKRRCAIMCAEALWWRCHRRLVTDYLIARGIAVFHIMNDGPPVPAHLTPGAAVQGDGTVLYPALKPARG